MEQEQEEEQGKSTSGRSVLYANPVGVYHVAWWRRSMSGGIRGKSLLHLAPGYLPHLTVCGAYAVKDPGVDVGEVLIGEEARALTRRICLECQVVLWMSIRYDMQRYMRLLASLSLLAGPGCTFSFKEVLT